MKKTYLLAIIFICSVEFLSGVIANAGTSEQDPTVLQLRDQFAKAHVPSIAELRLSQNWTCAEFDALPGVFDTKENMSVAFNKLDGIIQYSAALNEPDQPNVLLPRNFSFQPVGLVSVMSYIPQDQKIATDAVVGYLIIRADNRGALVAEWVMKALNEAGKKALSQVAADPSLAYPEAIATGYSICVRN